MSQKKRGKNNLMQNNYEDITLKCKDCGKTFIWKAKEQSFYADKGYGAPIRCWDCRQLRKIQKEEPKKTQEQINEEFSKMLDNFLKESAQFESDLKRKENKRRD